MSHPILYSYRRCPYAMRARLSIYFSQIQVEQREIVFWDKPEPMLAASPKGTVPVLILPDGTVIDESWDIMCWALAEHRLNPVESAASIEQWVTRNDNEFKVYLDAYKYPESEHAQQQAREQGEVFLQQLESVLSTQPYLLGASLSIVDLALFPFIRQFANVDKAWFAQANYPALRRWLQTHLESEYFQAVMKKRPVWQASHQALWVNEPAFKTRDQFVAKAEGKK